MGKHSAHRGEEGRFTASTRGNAQHDGKHRQGTAPGSSGQNRTTKSDIPHRDGRRD